MDRILGHWQTLCRPHFHDGGVFEDGASVLGRNGGLREAHIEALEIRGIETLGSTPAVAKAWNRKRSVRLPDALRLVRLMLRERIWARLHAPRRAFVHVGYDYYMYVGLNRPTPEAIARTTSAGLYVEPFRSPYARAV
jgi:small subunit ribosomal protein S1